VQPQLQVAAPPQRLEQQHPVAVDVALVRHRQRHPQLGRRVPGRAPRAGDGQVRVLPVAQPGQPEVGHLGRQAGAQEHVLRLDVVVDDPLRALLVQVPQRLGRADGDLVELAEADRLLRRRVEQVPVQRAVLHVLVHERLHRGVEAEAVEADEVDVVGPADGADLRHELLLGALAQRAVEHLHGHRRAVREPALVHHAEAAGADLVGVVPGEGAQLLRAEPHRTPLLLDVLEEVAHAPHLHVVVVVGGGGLVRAAALAVAGDGRLGLAVAAASASLSQIRLHAEFGTLVHRDYGDDAHYASRDNPNCRAGKD